VEAHRIVRRRGSHNFPDNRLTYGGNAVSLMRQPPFTPRKIPGSRNPSRPTAPDLSRILSILYIIYLQSEIFLLPTVSRSAPRPTQFRIQWVPGALSPVVRRPGHETNHPPPSIIPRPSVMKLYLHSPIRLHAVMFN
jgi:hypothetical protein